MIKSILLILLLATSIAAQTHVADNYDTTTSTGSYRIGGQSVLRWDAFFTNYVCGKVSTNLQYWGAQPAQQNFICGNVVYLPSSCCNTTFGWDSARPTTGWGNTFFGHDAGLGVQSGSGNTCMGMQCGVPDQNGSIQVNGSTAVGAGSIFTASNQLVIGGVAWPIKQGYIGGGVTNTFAQAFTLQTTGGQGTNNPGAPLIIAAGKSTGSATPAVIKFATSQPTVSGSTPQTLIDRWEITGTGRLKALTTDSKVIMRSPSGQCWEVSVMDSGILTTVQVGC